MAVYKYIRFSTNKQDEQSQCDIIQRYCEARGVVVDETISDEGLSGKAGSLSKRDLLKLLQRMQEGDTLLVSELSRITRGGTVEFSRIISEYFEPAKIILVLCNYSMVFDFANLTPMNELILSCFAVFAKMERDSIIDRTNAGLSAIKDKIATDGGFISKRTGEWRTHLGREKGVDMSAANRASALAATNGRLEWLKESAVGKYVQSRMQQGWTFTHILGDLQKMYEISPEVYCTRTGKPVGKGQLSVMMQHYRGSTAIAEMSEAERRNGGKIARSEEE